MMEAEGGGGAQEEEPQRKAEERDIKIFSNGKSSFSSVWDTFYLQWKALEGTQTTLLWRLLTKQQRCDMWVRPHPFHVLISHVPSPSQYFCLLQKSVYRIIGNLKTQILALVQSLLSLNHPFQLWALQFAHL